MSSNGWRNWPHRPDTVGRTGDAERYSFTKEHPKHGILVTVVEMVDGKASKGTVTKTLIPPKGEPRTVQARGDRGEDWNLLEEQLGLR
ncbi:MAG TPA: hypothetical protein VIW24_06145 [Aldersonia sp.]